MIRGLPWRELPIHQPDGSLIFRDRNQWFFEKPMRKEFKSGYGSGYGLPRKWLVSSNSKTWWAVLPLNV